MTDSSHEDEIEPHPFKEHLKGAERLLRVRNKHHSHMWYEIVYSLLWMATGIPAYRTLRQIRQYLAETKYDPVLKSGDLKRKRNVVDDAEAEDITGATEIPPKSLIGSLPELSEATEDFTGTQSSSSSTRLHVSKQSKQDHTLPGARTDNGSKGYQTRAILQTAGSDPMIYPGLYAPSGFDMLSILLRVLKRPRPVFDIGFVDSSCALVLCALSGGADEADTPIVYCSDAFSHLTHYQLPEIVGRNCRFLQSPDGIVSKGSIRKHVDNKQIYDLKQKLRRGEETQTCLINYKKGGEKFVNYLTTVEIEWGGDRGRYIVGFQAQGPARWRVAKRQKLAICHMMTTRCTSESHEWGIMLLLSTHHYSIQPHHRHRFYTISHSFMVCITVTMWCISIERSTTTRRTMSFGLLCRIYMTQQQTQDLLTCLPFLRSPVLDLAPITPVSRPAHQLSLSSLWRRFVRHWIRRCTVQKSNMNHQIVATRFGASAL